MRIDYCPKCHKAGLREQDPKGFYSDGRTGKQRYEAYLTGLKIIASNKKWCPRCKEWVEPENHPYIGIRGIK